MPPLPRIDRRTALKWMVAATASAGFASRFSKGQQPSPPPARGYGTDPVLNKIYHPGDLWPLTLTEPQRHTAAALCDVIIPADAQSPSASSVGVVDFIDEWISAPYPEHVEDRTAVLSGLGWLDEEAKARFGKPFADLAGPHIAAICDAICHQPSASAELEMPARFFAVFRDLTAGGFYTTPEGREDLRYIGNTPLVAFDGPPPEVLRQAGLV